MKNRIQIIYKEYKEYKSWMDPKHFRMIETNIKETVSVISNDSQRYLPLKL